MVLGVLLVLSLLLASCAPATPTVSPAPTQPPPTPTAVKCEKTTWLSVFTGWVGEPARVIQELNRKFEEENPCTRIDFQAPGSEHEHLLKIKMAANDMPDVWWTHKWGKLRYGKFVYDLRD